MEIYLVRHGRTTQPGTYTGVSDVELSQLGVTQVRDLGSYFKAIEFDHLFCSTLVRCRRTLELLELNAEKSFDENLREIDFGSWEGMDIEAISADHPEQVEQWMVQKEQFQFPGGEKINDFAERITAWFNDLLQTQFERVLVVSHGGVIRIGLCHLLGIGLDNLFVFHIEEASVARVRHKSGYGRLELLNCRG